MICIGEPTIIARFEHTADAQIRQSGVIDLELHVRIAVQTLHGLTEALGAENNFSTPPGGRRFDIRLRCDGGASIRREPRFFPRGQLNGIRSDQCDPALHHIDTHEMSIVLDGKHRPQSNDGVAARNHFERPRHLVSHKKLRLALSDLDGSRVCGHGGANPRAGVQGDASVIAQFQGPLFPNAGFRDSGAEAVRRNLPNDPRSDGNGGDAGNEGSPAL